MNSMTIKHFYAVQPYHVGSKYGNSLAIVIPANLAKKYNMNTDTIFAVKDNDEKRIVTLQMVKSSQMNEGESD
jgi:antitoxin component of MazEF toxin-antitoxin module